MTEKGIEVKQDGVAQDLIAAVTGDSQAKKMGIAKMGGEWFKNYHTGTLYRIQDGKLMETRRGAVSPVVVKKNRLTGPRRRELMEAVKAKGVSYHRVMNKAELEEVLRSSTTKERIKDIQDGAVKRWKGGWNTKGKTQEGVKAGNAC
jgi:hypothetical protein